MIRVSAASDLSFASIEKAIDGCISSDKFVHDNLERLKERREQLDVKRDKQLLDCGDNVIKQLEAL